MDKNNMETAAYVFSLVMMFSGVLVYLGFKNLLVLIRMTRNNTKFPSLKRVSEESMEMNQTCRPHSWHKTTLALRGLDPGSYLVCTGCGIVSGHSLKVNEAGLEVLRNNIKIDAEKKSKEERQVRRTQEILNADFELWTKTFLNQFGQSPEKNLELLKKFSVFTVMSVNDAAHRAIREAE